MTVCVIDTSAVLSSLQDETGGDVAFDWLERGAAISILNVQELVSKLAEAGMDRADIEATLTDLPLDVWSITDQLALEAGLMRSKTGRRGLSHGDRACLALASSLALPAITADRAWTELSEELAVEVILIR